ncbi:unnamed protein product [Lactuca saligna]|uniref:EamA domain-containing protein n=1 Tax=Lactuca saligna TaxID=75948 RepID=A0AA36DZ06_LACSI|nr:unnamed protein product [Lactuca saligna]
MKSKTWRWVLGLIYILAVATIWIAASFVVQSVVDGGVSPFFVTYICNSLFVIYIPLVEIGRYLEDKYTNANFLFWRSKDDNNNNNNNNTSQGIKESEAINLLVEKDVTGEALNDDNDDDVSMETNVVFPIGEELLDSKGRWTRIRIAKVSLLICPFWFLAQLSFNLSLKYTTVTSNTILSSASSLFTFLVSLVFLGEKFTWIKLLSVLLCMGGTIIMMMQKLGVGKSAWAQFLGFLGLFNLLIFSPVALILHLASLEPFDTISSKQFGLIVGKGLLDNVLSDYLWAKAVLLTTTTVATAGLTIQVPLAAIVDTVIGNAPGFMDYIGAAAVMLGFAGINIPSDTCTAVKESTVELEENHITTIDHQ